MISKGIFLFVFVLNFSLTTKAFFLPIFDEPSAQLCENTIQGGDYFPWCLAKKLQATDISGYWISETDPAFSIHIKSKNQFNLREGLEIYFHYNNICSAPTATGIGQLDHTQKNVVTALIQSELSDNKFVLNLGIFDKIDISCLSNNSQNVLGATIRLLNPLKNFSNAVNSHQLESNLNQNNVYNLILRKVEYSSENPCEELN